MRGAVKVVLRTLCSALVLWVGAIGSVQAQTPEQAVAIARAESVGRELYEHDRAAWLATDALFAELGDGARERLRGWVTERQGESVVITFVAAGSEATTSLYRAVYRAEDLQERGETSEPLSAAQLRLYRAREAAIRVPVEFCSQAYNSVTLPREGSGVVDVYLMPGTTDPGEVLVGGYHRIAVDEASVVVETQAFSRSCLTLRKDDPAMRNAEEVFLWFSHIVTTTPTETHVFINLSQALPLYVSTQSGLWALRDGRVSFEHAQP